MGVTYKLNKEIVDFIVQKKKEKPSLSCRSLTGIIREAFQVEVSKSSINAVIKEFELSNPVGRRPVGSSVISAKAPRNFLIPPEKKEQLFARVAPFLPELPPEVIEAKQEAVPRSMEIPPESLPKKEVFLEKVPEVMAPIKFTHIVQEVTEPVERKTTSFWATDDSLVMDNAGFFFVRAIMQDIFRRPVIGKVFSGAAGMDPDEAGHLEAAVFLQAMGVFSVEDLHSLNVGVLWNMFDISAEKGKELLDRFLGKNVVLSALDMALDVELEAGLAQGNFFKCVSDGGRNFYFSADLRMFLREPAGGRPCPVFKAVELAVDSFFSGRKPLIFDLSCFGQQEGDLLVFLTGRARDRLDKIELWSEKHGKLWERIVNVGQRIKFIAKVEGSEGVFQKIEFDAIDNPLEHEDVDLDARYGLVEGMYCLTDNKDQSLRAVIVKKEGSEEKDALLTNILEYESSLTGLFNEYLQERSFSSLSQDMLGKDDIKYAIPHKNKTIYDVLQSVFIIFEEITRKSIFPFVLKEEPISDFLKMPAKVRVEAQSMHIRFIADPSAGGQRKALAHAVDLANGLCLKDRAGRRFFFSIES